MITGRRIFILVACFFCFCVLPIVLILWLTPNDVGGREPERAAQPSDEYPLAGIWKKGSCAEQKALAIWPVGKRQYGITLCGPNGCIIPGKFRPNSTIVNDKEFRVINNNTLEIKDKVKGFQRFFRCNR